MKEKVKLLISQINQLYEKEYFHLLSGNLLFLIEIFKQYYTELEGLHDNIVTILKKILPEIDRQADYYYWRETLHKTLYKLYEVIPVHLQDQLVDLLKNHIRAGKENPYNPNIKYESWDISNQLTQALDKAKSKNDFKQIFATLSACLFKTLYPYHEFLEQNNLASFDEWLKTCVLIDNILILQWLELHEDKAEYWRLFYVWINITKCYLEKEMDIDLEFDNNCVLLKKLLPLSEQQSPSLQAAALFCIFIKAQRQPQHLELLIAKVCEINNKEMDSVLTIPQDKNNDNSFSLLKLSQRQKLERLPQMRKVFSDVNSIVEAQKQFSQKTILLLKKWLHEAAELLGKPPTQISLGVLGSSSRQDSMPYSDVELFCLHGEINNLQAPQLRLYLDALLHMLELKIISQNETPRSNNSQDGFRIDSSTHLLTSPHLIGTPELVVCKKLSDKYHFVFIANNIVEKLETINKKQTIDKNYSVKLVNDLTNDIKYLEEFIKKDLYSNLNCLFDYLKSIKTILLQYLQEDNCSLVELVPSRQKLIDLVPQLAKDIIDDESFFSLLQPIFIDLNANSLTKTYFDAVNGWLDTFSAPVFTNALMKIFLQKAPSLNKSSLLLRHNIALFCYGDILQKSNATTIKINAGTLATKINLKRDYYKPLTYLGICLRLYYGWELHEHPIDLFEQAHKQNVLGHGVSKLLQCALKQINRLRAKAHSEANKQEDIILLDTELAKKLIDFKAELTLTMIREGILQPLKQSFLQALNAIEKFSWQKVCASILPAYLKQRRHWYNLAKAQQLEDQCELLVVLADFPEPDGWSPTSETQWNNWLAIVRSLFLTPEQSPALSDGTRCIISGYPTLIGANTPALSFRLPAEITAQRFDKLTGEVIGNPDYSSTTSDLQRKGKSSKIFTYVWENHTLFFRFKEGNRECLLGCEIAVELLHRLLGGKLATAPGWPLKLNYIPSSSEPKTHWCWVSLGITGENLGRAMLTDARLLKDKQTSTNINQKKLNQIDPISYSQLFILALLTYPEDGQPWNFLLEEFGELFRLIAIDNGQSFVNPWEADKKGNLVKILNIKTMLYLLPNFTQPLAPEVGEWISQLNVEQLIDNWRHYIQQVNLIFQPLIEKDLKAARIAEVEWEKLNKLIVVTNEQIEFIRFRLNMIKSWLSRHSNGTAQALLYYMEFLVAAEYAKYQGKIKTPKDYYDISPHTYVIKPLLRKDIQHHYQASSRNFQAFLNNTLQVGYIQFDKKAQANYINHIKSLHFEGMSSSEQRFLLRLMQQLIFNEELSLAHCTELTDTILETILKKSPMLTSIDISYCPQITEKSWLNIGWYCKNIEHINLSGNNQLKKLEKNIFGFSDFKRLKKLNIADCQLPDEAIGISLKNIELQDVIYFKSNSLPYGHLLKIVMVHNGPVGSSCLLYRFTEGKFRHDLDLTIGVEFGSKILKIEDKIVKLQIWNGTGQERFKSILLSYCEGASAFILIIDITCRYNLDSVYENVGFIHKFVNKDIPILLVGNKCDLKDYREITYEEGVQIAQKIGAFRYIECSAKEGTNVEAAFTLAAKAAKAAKTAINVETVHALATKAEKDGTNVETAHTLAAKAADNKNSKMLNSHKLEINIDRSYELLPHQNSLYLILIGCTGAGKSSWLYKLVEGIESSGPDKVGVKFKLYKLKSNHSIDNSLHQAIIWECDGVEELNSIIRSNFNSKEIIILFIDKTRPLVNNFQYVEYIKKYNSMANTIVVANKIDLVHSRVFSYIDGVNFAESIGAVKYIECSVKTGYNLNDIFIEAANLSLIRKFSLNEISRSERDGLEKALQHSDVRLRQLAAEALLKFDKQNEQIKQVFKQNLQSDILDIWYSAKKALGKLDLLATNSVLNILKKNSFSDNEFIGLTSKKLFRQYKGEKTACQFLIITRLFYQLLHNPFPDEFAYLCCNEIINKIIDYTFDAINQPENLITTEQCNSIKAYASDRCVLLKKHNKQKFLRAIGIVDSDKILFSNEDLYKKNLMFLN